MMERAFDEVEKALSEGELVGIFPEGRITDSGELYPFRPGVTRILERNPVPVIPLALQGSGLYSPLAVAIIGGLISSTLLARLVTPVMYKLLPPAIASWPDAELVAPARA